jgi:hypothetical protein
MAIPRAPAVVAVISVIGVGILKVVEGDHDLAFFLDLFFSNSSAEAGLRTHWKMRIVIPGALVHGPRLPSP